ncbi:MAG: ornithine carbamoyltransferase [Spirochaetes bacterium]|nr:ornithine carbamoyltransferase [Spirochaetota bacterium]
MAKDIITINELSKEEIIKIVNKSIDIKKNPVRYENKLIGKTLLLLFQKTSTRTRIAFELGMKKLGGTTIVMDWGKSNFAISSLRYEARYVADMVDAILARLIKNEDVCELARSASVPVINGCCDMYHPSQVLADLMTVYEVSGGFNTSMAYIGIQNNVANSLFYACLKVGVKLIFVTPLNDKIPDDFEMLAKKSKIFEETLNLEYAVSNSKFLYTDTWINMEEYNREDLSAERDKKIKTMAAYQINRELIENRDVRIMHDMPVHPGLEIDEYAINCGKSVIFQQAENRMYAGQALLLYLLDAL